MHLSSWQHVRANIHTHAHTHFPTQHTGSRAGLQARKAGANDRATSRSSACGSVPGGDGVDEKGMPRMMLKQPRGRSPGPRVGLCVLLCVCLYCGNVLR